ncbi:MULTISPECIES: ABC transporter permease [Comamonas]|uniref:ABC transporter permease n=1 Tax=Comamonas terrigena TaxID=32013 RepID=A0A2A7UV36_COMTR|nr:MULTISPECIES: ABC transporter permease [Comamonas]MBD9530405.1 ABC transporter permease [Comamonas sp. CMM01]PEH89133.1 ABC transporter permease [Comamonas terrigena]BBL24241.1 peptide ABC transporter permease [Comamonas terrigena NBRC 13299]SUY72159.1 Glutathione transport system permease protein gsiC [Comamonas terrigena]
MTAYLLRRTGQALLVLWAAFSVSFVLLQLMPGDAVLIKFLNPDLGLGPEQIADIQAAYGADQPVWRQYLHTLGQFLTGHFGYSLQAGVPVSEGLATNLPPTLRLAALGLAAALLLALGLALAASVVRVRAVRALLQSLPSLFVSIPVFWLGIMLIQWVSFRWGWVPVINPGPWQGLILPTLTLAVPISAPLAQILMRNLDAALAQPYVAVARAKGASQLHVLLRHAARNALLPVLTMTGVLFGELLAGAVVTEAVFGLNGLGSLTQQAVGNQDTAVLQAVVMVSAAAFVTINLIVDLLYPWLDPRLRHAAGG